MEIHESDQQRSQQTDLIEIPEELFEAQKEALLKEKQWQLMVEASGSEEKGNFRDYDQSQIYYVSVQFKEFLEADHPARVNDAVVERMDLSQIFESYSEEGNPPYHPKMMLKVLFYAYYRGLMSCRKIWDVLVHRSDFIFLAAGQVPNFRTVNAFRLRHLDVLPQLFSQIVLMCVQLGMMDFKGLEKEYRKVKEGMKRSG